MTMVRACSTTLLVHIRSKTAPRNDHSTAEIRQLCTNDGREPCDVRTPCLGRPCFRSTEQKNDAERVCNGYRNLNNVTVTSAASIVLNKICHNNINGDKHKCRTQRRTNAHAQKRTQTHKRTGTLAHTRTNTHIHTHKQTHARALSRVPPRATPERMYFFVARVVSDRSQNIHSGLMKQMILSFVCCRLKNAATLTAKFSDAFNA